jgi:hypothetical protein
MHARHPISCRKLSKIYRVYELELGCIKISTAAAFEHWSARYKKRSREAKSASPIQPTKKPHSQRQRQIDRNNRALQIRSVAPAVEPQKEKDDTGKIAKADVNHNTQSRASLFCVEAVEKLAFAIFHVKLGLSFRNGGQSSSVHHARSCARPIIVCKPSLPIRVRRASIVVVVEVKFVMRDGAFRRHVYGRTRGEVVTQIGVIRKSDFQARARVNGVLLEEEEIAEVVGPSREPQTTPSANFIIFRLDLLEEVSVSS